MKISIPVDSRQQLGGGFTFARNLAKGLKQIGVEVVDDPLQSDIAVICGVTMVEKNRFNELKEKGIKTLVRLDNVPRNSRNRGTGTNRLRSFAQQATAIVWQGQWAKWYLEDFIGREGTIIHNGIDLNIFTSTGRSLNLERSREDVYLYSRFSRDETKQWEVAWYQYQLIQRQNPSAHLLIIGKFSEENVQYDFDFFRGESYDFLGVVDTEESMAKVLRSTGHLLATYFNDAFANTYLEALACGVQLYEPNMTGGTPEMFELWNEKGRDYFSLSRMATDYARLFEQML